MKLYTVRLSEETIRRLKIHAAHRSTTVQAIVGEAIGNWLARHKVTEQR